jgi:hypothetical protein
MATAKPGVISSSVRGRVGDLIFKQYRYGTVVTRVPDMSKAGSSEKQQAGRLRFKEAVAYARIAVKNAGERKRLKKKRGKGSPYNKAIKEYMKGQQPPV